MAKSNKTNRQLLEEIHAAVTRQSLAGSGFDKPSGGQIFPAPPPPPTFEKPIDCSDFVNQPGTAYHDYVAAFPGGVEELVRQCRMFWGQRETFYDPVKAFVAAWPQYFV